MHPDTWIFVALGVATIAASIFLSQFFSWTAVIGLVLLVCAAGYAIVRPESAAVLLAFVAPMSGLAINFSQDPSYSRIPYIGAINAPLVDLLAIGVLLIIGLLFFLRPETVHLERLKILWKPIAIFYCVVALAVYYGETLFFGTEVKSFFRPYLFAFAAFAVPMMVLLKNKSAMMSAMFAYECAAVLGAMMGAISLFTGNVIVFARAIPFSIFGHAPFGVNHNVLAESLTAIMPFAWWFAAKQPRGTTRNLLFAAATLISGVALLTFSRAAWIVIALQVCLFVWWKFCALHAGHDLIPRRRLIIIVLTAVAALAIFFSWIQSTAIADSSDSTRKDLLGIAVTYWQRAPWFGQGPGTYLTFVGETTAFRMDYGDPMDAHGVVQKLMLETGLVGTIAFVVMVGMLLHALWRRRAEPFHYMLFVTVISLWGYQLFNTGYFDGKVWVLMGIAFASLIL